jgi:uracil-DNA glycosylase
MTNELEKINKKIVYCKKCPRLARYIRNVAKSKVKRFIDQNYWGRPLTGFGDTKARLLLIGLAPAAHGGNRTGRMFTGDSSGDWLAKALYENGFSTKPTSQKIGDGFVLVDAYVTAALRCAPPQNKPLKEELANCSGYLRDEFGVLDNVKVMICLGKIAFYSCCKLLHIKGVKFGHGKSFTHQNYTIICSYHPSKQNTQTGKLTWIQWSHIFSTAKAILDDTK